jgi:hypothetical protein
VRERTGKGCQCDLFFGKESFFGLCHFLYTYIGDIR